MVLTAVRQADFKFLTGLGLNYVAQSNTIWRMMCLALRYLILIKYVLTFYATLNERKDDKKHEI